MTRMTGRGLSTGLFLLAATPALAQVAGPFDSIAMCRLSVGSVLLTGTYFGAPCWETRLEELLQQPEYAMADLILEASAPEGCVAAEALASASVVMQMNPDVNDVSVLLYGPGGSPLAQDFVTIAPEGPECIAP